jgi:phenylpropionate dioxygenase-like ring-hydroxylating dioxygenase large terminal subunit
MLAGELHASDDTCPHAGCSLAEGELDGQTVVCPCHMATFDVTTGEVVDGPAPSGVATRSVVVADGALVLREPRSPEREGTPRRVAHTTIAWPRLRTWTSQPWSGSNPTPCAASSEPSMR